jgi:hypothetical protein
MCAIFIGIAMNRYKGEKYMLKIGSHVGMSGKEMLLGEGSQVLWCKCVYGLYRSATEYEKKRC